MAYIINPYSKEEYVFNLIVGFSYLSSTRTGSFAGWRKNVYEYFRGMNNCGCRVILCKIK